MLAILKTGYVRYSVSIMEKFNHTEDSEKCFNLTLGTSSKIQGFLFPLPSCLALILNLSFFIFILKQKLTHPNIKLMLANASFSATVICVCHCIISFYRASLLIYGSYYPVSILQCPARRHKSFYIPD